ncbi:MAG: choice-of-anchor D domain-containing protein [Candidatus Eisenbacteria bacterium]|uniref:Choice-of-anchor D domain-containing protein n=1 Tax=Eiseniibacteriota bacterium TaxID=2212470 RepID=A0A7Y2EA54_UNCEI|nr:choice-of-anchor D domain-containing protein [Candidatus Eisenbacteria bacterium]
MPRTLLLSLLFSLTLAAPGFTAPICDVVPTSLEFGSIPEGTTAVDSFQVTNSGTGNLSLSIAPPVAPFLLLQGAGNTNLKKDESLTVIVQFAPTAVETSMAILDLGSGLCSMVDLTGIGIAAVESCAVAPSSVDFGAIALGLAVVDTVVVENLGNVDLNLTVGTSPSPPFTLLQGSGGHVLPSGNSLSVVVEYAPTALTSDAGIITLGNTLCPDVPLSGEGAPAVDSCLVSTTLVDLGDFFIPLSGTPPIVTGGPTATFTIENVGSTVLSDTFDRLDGTPSDHGCSAFYRWADLDPNGPECEIQLCFNEFGFGVSPNSYTLNPGEIQTFTVDLQTTVPGTYSCLLTPTGPPICPPIELRARALRTSSGDGAKMAMHLQAPSTKNQCLPASQGGQLPDLTPCSQYVSSGATLTGYDVYVTAAGYRLPNARYYPDEGIGGAEFGLNYNGTPGQGVDVFAWTSCADLAFPSATWPDPSGGITLTFDPANNCQNAPISGFESENGHAVLGVLYVYAYDDDQLQITGRNNIPLPLPKLADCLSVEADVLLADAGAVGFGEPGCNPCLEDCSSALGLPDDSGAKPPIAFAPNPFSHETAIRFTLDKSTVTSLQVFDLAGRKLRSTAPHLLPAGTHQLRWNGATDHGAPVPAGVYYVRVLQGDHIETHRVVRLQ